MEKDMEKDYQRYTQLQNIGWRLFGIGILLLIPYSIYWIYIHASYYISQTTNIPRPVLPTGFEIALYILFWLGIIIIAIAVAIILIAAFLAVRLAILQNRHSIQTKK